MNDLDRLIRDLPKFDASARVGIFGDEHAEEAVHLLWAEFGTKVDGKKREPARPTLTAAFDSQVGRTADLMRDGAVALLDGKVRDGKAALDPVAFRLAEVHRSHVLSNTPPPLKPATLANRRRRGVTSTATLVDSGAMLKAIAHEVKDGGDGWPG